MSMGSDPVDTQTMVFACVLKMPLSFDGRKCYNVRVFLIEHCIMVVKRHKGAVKLCNLSPRRV